MGTRVTVGILAAHHKQLAALGEATGHKLSAMVDRAIDTWLETEAPVWRRAADEIKTKKLPRR